MRKIITVLAGVALAALLTGTAQAAPGDRIWVAKSGAVIVDHNTVLLNKVNTSVEAADLGITLDAPAEASFTYALGGTALCGGGSPRVFFKVGGTYVNSFDSNPDQCGGEDGKVTFTLPAGVITEAGVVYDFGPAGTVTVHDLAIAGKVLDFRAVVPPLPTPTPTATNSPTAAPTGTPTPTPTATGTPTPDQPTSGPTNAPTSAAPTTQAPPTTGAPTVLPTTGAPVDPEPPAGGLVPAGNELPVTGDSGVPSVALWGLGIVLAGAALGLLASVRLRRNRFQA